MKKALVVTPTTGATELADAIKSVQNQTYKNIEHLIVVDGAEFSKNTDTVFQENGFSVGDKIKRVDLAYNTGGGGFYGHRVMAAFSHLVPHDYILFLDQDNWYDENHVESLVEECEKYDFQWSYSLRKVYNKEKKYICNDDCESLGRWPVWCNENGYLIDSSAYCFSQSFIRLVGHIWDWGWGADRRFYTILKDDIKHNSYSCSGLYTLNYRLGGNEGSVQSEFFLEGNKKQQEKYNNILPWSLQIK